MTYEFESPKEKSVFLFLDELRRSGACNMFESGSYVRDAFPELDKQQVQDFFLKWTKTFSERQT